MAFYTQPRPVLLIGAFFILLGIGLFAGSRVVAVDYYYGNSTYQTASVQYYGLTWSGVAAFVIGWGFVGQGYYLRKRRIAAINQGYATPYPPGVQPAGFYQPQQPPAMYPIAPQMYPAAPGMYPPQPPMNPAPNGYPQKPVMSPGSYVYPPQPAHT
ncbi:hypothetical protein H4R33_001283 [Dimargaris cristalligena]|uniref:Uncharacterized protein n=1 Tax=Dimargaris cristalligena TaxID=215637 RepID=A0A4Q0A0N2_9FUNG|nr:hypothetical protein H4R33_001283 [Dimargaris cristalligena]RKP38832.1 hypothetical protein BJ085DRAFT_30833 [Dimargaris cristalligena]|eukprot:RKP38832.1 hypothetical protein BJ085DRAFT_30833 [Dimargaris cristalligena]